MAAKRTEASQSARYRIVAAEAHSWSSLLLEDERGRHYLYVVGTKALTKMAAKAAGDLLAQRAYRTWRGERTWTALDRLPIFQQPAESPVITSVPTVVPTTLLHDDAQPA